MTNEEAITRMKEIIDECLKSVDDDNKDVQALRLAVNALEEVEEWKKLKLICANEGIVVYKQRGDV